MTVSSCNANTLCATLFVPACVCVLQVWLVSRKQTAHLACVLTGCSVMYYNILWAVTGDMAAPIMAAMLHAGTECWLGSLQADNSGARSNRL